jgi:hypothetical protein
MARDLEVGLLGLAEVRNSGKHSGRRESYNLKRALFWESLEWNGEGSASIPFLFFQINQSIDLAKRMSMK